MVMKAVEGNESRKKQEKQNWNHHNRHRAMIFTCSGGEREADKEEDHGMRCILPYRLESFAYIKDRSQINERLRQ
jgi:hypothetical protein